MQSMLKVRLSGIVSPPAHPRITSAACVRKTSPRPARHPRPHPAGGYTLLAAPGQLPPSARRFPFLPKFPPCVRKAPPPAEHPPAVRKSHPGGSIPARRPRPAKPILASRGELARAAVVHSVMAGHAQADEVPQLPRILGILLRRPRMMRALGLRPAPISGAFAAAVFIPPEGGIPQPFPSFAPVIHGNKKARVNHAFLRSWLGPLGALALGIHDGGRFAALAVQWEVPQHRGGVDAQRRPPPAAGANGLSAPRFQYSA